MGVAGRNGLRFCHPGAPYLAAGDGRVRCVAIAAGTNPKRFLAWFAPPVVGAILLDRWYQWHRFGELFNTYIGIFGRRNRAPHQTASLLFSYPFWKGFLGTFFSPDKSVLLFDPLLIIVLLLAVRNWGSLDRGLRLLLVCLTLLLVAYSLGYARYFDFGGDSAWGHRYVLLPVQLLCLFAVPLLFQHRWLTLGPGVRLRDSAGRVDRDFAQC